MLCWSCGKEIPDSAKRCRHCEAEVEPEPGEEEISAVKDFLDNMSPDVLSELRAAFEKSESGEEFANRIMVGDCPACGSSNTSDCASDPDIEDICIGRCIDCGLLWCLDCGQRLHRDQPTCPQCSSEEPSDERSPDEDVGLLRRHHLLAAEIFGYSFANYRDHLGIGHERFERLMPQDVKTLERAHREQWPTGKLANALSASLKKAKQFLRAYEEAVQVVDAENPAESFRNAVRFVVRNAIAQGLEDEDSVEDLVTQICYRAADLAVLLDMEGQPLSRYSRHLRRERDVRYGEGYFD